MIYFNNVPRVGDLYFDKVIFQFEDTDVLFTCKDESDNLYYCLCSENKVFSDYYSWLIAPSSEIQIKLVLKQKLTMLAPFEDAPEIIVAQTGYSVKDNGIRIGYQWCKYSDIPHNELPRKDSYIPSEVTASSIKQNKEA